MAKIIFRLKRYQTLRLCSWRSASLRTFSLMVSCPWSACFVLDIRMMEHTLGGTGRWCRRRGHIRRWQRLASTARIALPLCPICHKTPTHSKTLFKVGGIAIDRNLFATQLTIHQDGAEKIRVILVPIYIMSMFFLFYDESPFRYGSCSNVCHNANSPGFEAVTSWMPRWSHPQSGRTQAGEKTGCAIASYRDTGLLHKRWGSTSDLDSIQGSGPASESSCAWQFTNHFWCSSCPACCQPSSQTRWAMRTRETDSAQIYAGTCTGNTAVARSSIAGKRASPASMSSSSHKISSYDSMGSKIGWMQRSLIFLIMVLTSRQSRKTLAAMDRSTVDTCFWSTSSSSSSPVSSKIRSDISAPQGWLPCPVQPTIPMCLLPAEEWRPEQHQLSWPSRGDEVLLAGGFGATSQQLPTRNYWWNPSGIKSIDRTVCSDNTCHQMD